MTAAIDDEDLEKVTELASFDPSRLDGVDGPATGSGFLMLKALASPAGSSPAESGQPAAQPEEAPVTPAATEIPDSAEAPAPESPVQDAGNAVKSAAAEDEPLGTITLPPSPADMAKLKTLRRRLAMAQAATKAARKVQRGRAAKADDGKKGKPAGLTDAIKSKFVSDLADTGKNPTAHVSQWLHRCNEWAATGHYPTGLSYSDVRWMAAKCVAELKKRNPGSEASMDGFPAAKGTAAKETAADEGSAEKCQAGQAALTAAASDSEGHDTRKAADREGGEPGGGEGAPAEKARKPKPKGKKPFPGAAPEFGSGSRKDDGKAGKGTACKCGAMLAKGDRFCPSCGKPDGGKAAKARAVKCGKCGAPGRKGGRFCPACGAAAGKTAKAKNKKPGAADARVDAAISRLDRDADAALAAQQADPDSSTHPADAKVSEALGHVKDDVEAAGDAQRRDEDTDDPARHGHAAKSGMDGPAYHLVRLHDATCAAFRHDDVILRHPAAAKGIAHVTDPQPFADAVTAALAADGGTGSSADSLPALSAGWQAALAVKAAAAQGTLDDAMESLRKEFAGYYPDAHPRPGEITPGEFRRPYISAGRAARAAGPGQKPRIPLAAHVPDPDDFRRPLITGGREAASPGSAVKAGREFYTNEARDAARGVLQGMHDYIADRHPDICPMKGQPYDGEDAVPGSMGSSLTTDQPVPAKFGKDRNRSRAVPAAVTAAQAAAVVTPHVTKGKKAAKAARKEAKAMAKALKKAQRPAAAPLLDPELLKSALSEVIAGQLGGITKTIGGLEERTAALESAPDPAQMTPRSAAGTAKARGNGQEVPAGGDGDRQADRIAGLARKAMDPDPGVRAAARSDLMKAVGREAAAELLAAL